MTEAADYVPVYRSLRGRVAELVSTAVPDTPVPATPEWDVHDLVAHVVGDVADGLAGNIADAAQDHWTAAQVEARRASTITDMLREWDELGPRLEELIPVAPRAAIGQLVFDAVTHEHDLRNALEAPGFRDTDAVTMSVGWVAAMGPRATASRADPVAIEWPGGAMQLGAGDPQATVRLPSAFEVLRAVSGRRSGSEIAAYEWDGSVPAEAMLMAPFFTVRPTPLDE